MYNNLSVLLKLESPRRKPVMYFQTGVLSAGIERKILGVENVVGDFIFSDDELAGSKAYIRSVKPKLKKRTEISPLKLPKEIIDGGRIFLPITIEIIVIWHL